MGFIDAFNKGVVPAQAAALEYKGTPAAGVYANVVHLLVDVGEDSIELLDIYTLPAKRGHGYARRALGWLKVAAHSQHMKIVVVPRAYGDSPMTTEKITRWFYRQGLHIVGGRDRYVQARQHPEVRVSK